MKQIVVFYDGSCRICVGFTGWLRHIDGKKQFRLEPYQDNALLSQYGLRQENLEREIHIMTSEGKIFRGADAVLEIWQHSGHWSGFAAVIFKVPPLIWLARLIYKLIARYRRSLLRPV